jgi:isopentenyl-diphosphate delta-isomerase
MTVDSATEERVILVDANDVAVGTEGKLRAHQKGLLHRAFSVFVLDSMGRVLLQQRADAKYHSGGLWSNTCCGHPRTNEDIRLAAQRRLTEEMGIVCELREVGTFTYRADLGNGLVEHEVDHLFIGDFEGDPAPDPAEVASWTWMPMSAAQSDCPARPGRYTAWFPLALTALGDAIP